MLLKPDYADGDIVCFKLVNGDEILARVLSTTNSGWNLSKPLNVVDVIGQLHRIAIKLPWSTGSFDHKTLVDPKQQLRNAVHHQVVANGNLAGFKAIFKQDDVQKCAV